MKKMNIKLVARSELIELLTVSPSTFWRIENQPNFPKKIKLGPNRVAYKVSEIEKWIDLNQIA
jgi:prophage regulatory protein